jgi:RNA recognition motif-containing protein
MHATGAFALADADLLFGVCRKPEIESVRFTKVTVAVRLFIGTLPYGASEADLRAHFAPIAEPTHVVMPVDRETGRPRGFAFVEFADRSVAEKIIDKFNAQPFMGRNLAVSEARAREDRPPGPRPPGGGFGGPRPGGFGGPRPSGPGGGFGGPRPGGGFGGGGGGFGGPRPGGPGGGRDRSANFGPPAPPKRLRGGKKSSQQEHKPRGPIKERTGGRIYDVDDLEDEEAIDIDNVATSAPEDDDTDTEE